MSRLAPTLDLLGERVQRATVWLDSRLELRFESGALIEIPFHPKYETWQVSGSDGLLIVSTPGGSEPALWPGGPDQEHATFEEIVRYEHLTIAEVNAEATAADERRRLDQPTLRGDEHWLELLGAMEKAGAERIGDLGIWEGHRWAIRMAHHTRRD